MRNVWLVIKSLVQDIFFSINTTEIVLKAKLLSLEVRELQVGLGEEVRVLAPKVASL